MRDLLDSGSIWHKSMKEILLETHVKNNRLVKCILKNFESVSSFSSTYQLNKDYVYGLIGFRYSPFQRDFKPTLTAQKIEAILEKRFEWLFPIELYKHTIRGGHVKSFVHRLEVSTDAARLMFANSLQRREIGQNRYEETLAIEHDDANVFQKMLETLTPREKDVINMRFGLLRDEGPLTLEGVAQKLRVSPERIRQTEATAIRKLRHPTRAKVLGGDMPVPCRCFHAFKDHEYDQESGIRKRCSISWIVKKYINGIPCDVKKFCGCKAFE